MFILLAFACDEPKTVPSHELNAALEESRLFYQSQPTYLKPITPKKMPEGLTSLSSESCGSCHTEIYGEWAASTHSKAWSDIQFQAELKKSTKNGGEVQWMCVRCHTPYWDQLSELVVDTSQGLDFAKTIPNPTFDAELQAEGIGCVSCHLGDGVILGPSGNSNAVHAVKKESTLLTPEVCSNCHQAEAYFSELNLACVFSTGEEHAASPQGQSGQSCQHCHMPTIERAVVVGGKPKVTRRHYFGGSLIPKSSLHASQMASMEPYYKDGLTFDVDMPTESQPGISIAYENTNAGHMLPAGDPERFLLIKISLTNDSEDIVYEHKIKIGSDYQWHPSVKLISDNRLKPKEKRSHLINISELKSGVYILRVVAEKWRITEDNLEYHGLNGKLPSHREFFNFAENLIIP